jgi:lysozyme family protein
MLTPSDYLNLFETCKLTTQAQKVKTLESVCKVILANQMIYQTVQRFVSVPWPLIAALHLRESDQDFRRHLHNGDSLLKRTVHVPKGRPVLGQPPFTWIESAVDALEHVWMPRAWDIAGCLEFLERYNGLGYQRKGINTPYLWDYTDKYNKGLYVGDGSFDAEKTESRPGCVAVVKTLEMKGVSLDFTSLAASDSALH